MRLQRMLLIAVVSESTVEYKVEITSRNTIITMIIMTKHYDKVNVYNSMKLVHDTPRHAFFLLLLLLHP